MNHLKHILFASALVASMIVIGTNHKIFNKLDMNKILTDKGFVCDNYGIHKVKA